jgi:hypothetical protein
MEGQAVPPGGYRKRIESVVALLILGTFPLACIVPEPTQQLKPFVGSLNNPNNTTLTIP